MTPAFRRLLSSPLRLMGYTSASSALYLPIEWQTPAQQEQLELAVVADQNRLTFLKQSFGTTFLTPQQNEKLHAMTNENAANAYFLGIHKYLRNSPAILSLLFNDTLLEDATDPLTHSTLVSLLGYQYLMPATLVRSGVNPQSLDVAVAYKVPGWDGGFFRRGGQQLEVGGREQRYRHISNEEVIRRLKQLQAQRPK